MHRKLIVGIAATLKSAGTAIFAINAESWDLNPAFYRVLKLSLLTAETALDLNRR
jgi:hypothetical protein